MVGYGISSYVIWVGDGSGGVENKSTIFSSTEGFVVFTFFGLPCFAPQSMNRLNCVSTGIFVVVAYSMMSKVVANNSSSYYDLDRIILRFPFPFSCFVFFFFADAIFFRFCFVIAYSRLSDSISSSNCSPPSC